MAWKLTIGGVDKTTSVTQTRTPRISMPLNGRATMSFTCVNGYTPTKRQEVIAYAQDGTTKLFGGVIVQRRMDAYHERTLPAWTHCECGDYSTYADWCYQTKSYTVGPTLEAVLDDLVADKLTAYGITVHGSQVTGPTLSPFDWTDKRVSDCLRELSDKTGYAYRIDADKKLRMFVPGTDAAPFGVTSGDPNVEDISWADSTEAPANVVSVRCGPDGTDSVTQTWTQAGGATSWVTDIPAARGAWAPGYVTVNGVFKTVGDGAMYEWETATSTLTLGTDSTPTNGWSIVLTYVAQFPFSVTATTGASPVIEAVYSYPDVTGYAAAVNLADGLLDRVAQEPRTISMPSTEIGWLPGQSMSIVHANRDLNDTDATITNVDIELITDSFWRYQLTAQETTAPQPGYVQEWRQLTAGGGQGGGSGGSGMAVLAGAPIKDSVVVSGAAYDGHLFTRPAGRETGGSGDACGMYFYQAGAPQDLYLANVAVGGATYGVDARTYMIANGWNDAGSGSSAGLAQVLCRSDSSGYAAVLLSAPSGVGVASGFLFSSEISPTQIVATTHNWNPTGLSTANVIRIDVDANRTITGLVAQTGGRLIWLYNTTAFEVTLAHDSGSSTAANRFYCYNAANFTLAQRASCWIRYDDTAARWTVL
jgi:hypothetical protein